MKLTDLHVHSTFSHDGFSTVTEQCEAALARGLRGLALTEHYEAMTSNPWGEPFMPPTMPRRDRPLWKRRSAIAAVLM